MTEAFYEPLGDGRYRAGEQTVGPWDPAAQHAGPPSALLARALELQPGAGPATVVRISVDILGPVPVGEVAVRVRTLRPGRRVELLEAELTAADRPVLRAAAWRIRRQELALPAHAAGSGEPVPPFPQDSAPFYDWPGGYLRAMEWRWATPAEPAAGAGVVWARMRVPLLPEEEPSGLQRALTLADSANGVSHLLDPADWLFVNTDLTVHLAAVPSGEWICLEARSRIDPTGFGLATSRLFDRDRLVGHGAQTLYVQPR